MNLMALEELMYLISTTVYENVGPVYQLVPT